MDGGFGPRFLLMAPEILPISATDFRLVGGPWPMPAEMRASVPEVWTQILARNPHVWDGRILGFTPPVLNAHGVLRAEAREDAYSAFLTWRAGGFADIGVVHVFGAALILSSDDALILGVMGGKTVNPGRVYPPGGSLEPRDVKPGGVVDVDGCIATELLEETGLDIADARAGALLAVSDGPRIAIVRVLHFERTADALLAQIRSHIASENDPELADVVACHTVADGEAAGDLAPYAAALLDAHAQGRLGV